MSGLDEAIAAARNDFVDALAQAQFRMSPHGSNSGDGPFDRATNELVRLLSERAAGLDE